jgi:uncharacterized phage-associated protein
MATITASRVATWLINLSHEKDAPVSNLKLQKLLYYSQAWNLAFYKEPLFEEDFEAWVHGPVVPEIFRTYRDHKWNSIPKVKASRITARAKQHLEEVWRVYGSLKAFDLERLTHSESPWKSARIGLAPDASSCTVISKKSMREYYTARMNGKAL